RTVSGVVIHEVRTFELGSCSLGEVPRGPTITTDERRAGKAYFLRLARNQHHVVVVVRDEDHLGVRRLQLRKVRAEVRLALLVALVDDDSSAKLLELRTEAPRESRRVRVLRDVKHADLALLELVLHEARGRSALLIVREAGAEYPLTSLRDLDGGRRRRHHR